MGQGIYEVKSTELTDGTLGFWWCGRYGMHKWQMPIEPVSVNLSDYNHVTICTPIWVFSVAAPIRSFCVQETGKIKEVDYTIVHHQSNSYENAADEMDQLLGLKRTGFCSVRCRKGQYKVVFNDISREEWEMHMSLEEKSCYPAMALVVLAVFYGVYFGKMLIQKRHGIHTHQIGRRKEKGLHTVEMLMSIATLGVPIAQLMSIAFGWNHLPANARFAGFFIGMLGDGIFFLSVLCMKDSWRAGIPDKDKTELVTTGIYRYSRNPAFLGFDFMYVGVLLMYGNLLTLGFSAFAMIMLHLQILQEEQYLAHTFGEPYREYCRHVFRYLGRR